MNKVWFNHIDGNLLIWLLLAHVSTDFIFQTQKMVEEKSAKGWSSKFLYIHGLIAAITIWIASGFNLPVWMAILAGLTHFLIDIIKIKLDKKKTILAFVLDQLAHVSVIIILWLFLTKKWDVIYKVTSQLASDYKVMLIACGYVLLIWPAGILIKMFINKLLIVNKPKAENQPHLDDVESAKNDKIKDDAEHAGRYVGIFERIIILTLVLLNQYDAIGFLITGKSIIRMGSKSQTEYVLMGTMLSYALAITTGVLINWLLVFTG
jgi:hypothetical protein